MCSFHNIEYISVPPKVNNPVTILTQEMSKYFLHSKGGAEKYRVNELSVCQIQKQVSNYHLLNGLFFPLSVFYESDPVGADERRLCPH